jgi:hypothetical protein
MSNKTNCYIDTTVLTEALLKPSDNRKKARATIKNYDRSFLPVYAIKELKCGPMKHFIWLHNRFAETKSFNRTMKAVHSNFRQRNLQATALEAWQVGGELLTGASLASATTRQQTQVALADSYRYALRRRIDVAWRDRRKLVSEVTDELSCFAEVAHSFNERTKLIDDQRRKCDLEVECCLAPEFRARKGDLTKLIAAIEGLTRPEDNRRRKALHLLLNTPKRPFDDKACKSLGDAFFALRCPPACAILTTNAKDHVPLAAALGKQVDEHKAP